MATSPQCAAHTPMRLVRWALGWILAGRELWTRGFPMTCNGVARRPGELVFPAPRLSFACELDPVRLVKLFADAAVIDDLLALDARVALMCSDFSDERAGVVRQLNAAGVPVTGIPLLPLADGYYFTADNTDQAAGRYQQWVAWTRRHELVWDSVGLDIEPDARIYLQIMNGPWGLLLPGSGPGMRSRWAGCSARWCGFGPGKAWCAWTC